MFISFRSLFRVGRQVFCSSIRVFLTSCSLCSETEMVCALLRRRNYLLIYLSESTMS